MNLFMLVEELWNTLTSKMTNSSLAEVHRKELFNFYNDAIRHYHNLNHIEYMLDLAQNYKDLISDYDTLLFSIYYHDVIYDAKRKDNELKSAELAAKRLRSISCSEEKIKKCYDQILATASHKIKEDSDTNYLLDFDLAVLGDSEEKYLEYSKNIRKEYAMYPNLLYNPARKKVLKHFLEMPQIFKTKEFIAEREEQARVNIENEISRL